MYHLTLAGDRAIKHGRVRMKLCEGAGVKGDIGARGDGYKELQGVVVTSRDVLPARSLAKGRKQL